MKPVFKSLLVASLLATAGFAAISQDKAPMMGQCQAMMGCDAMMHPGGHGGMGGMGKMGKMDPAKMEAMHTRHLAALKEKLKLNPEQMGAWTTFTAAMKPSAHPMMQRPDRAEMEKLTTPERIDKMNSLRTQRMADMQARMDQRDQAIKTFYAALNAEQQKTFDSEHARMAARGDGARGERMGRRANQPAAAASAPAKP